MLKKILTVCICCLGFFNSGEYVQADESILTISTSYKSLLSNPQQTGMLDRIVKEAFSRIGCTAEIVFSPTEKSIVNVNEGLLDGELNRIEGMEQNFSNLVRVPEPNMTMHFVAFSKRPYDIDGWESIKDLQIGIVRGWKILEENTADFPNVTLVPTETELFTMLKKDRLDVALYAMLTGYEQIKQRGLEGIAHLEPSLASRNMYLYMHKEHRHLVELLAGALRRMKQDGTYDRIITKSTAHVAIAPRGKE